MASKKRANLNMSKNESAHRYTISFEPSTAEKLESIAYRKNISVSELVRQYSEQGMKAQIGVDNIDMITHIIREQIENVMSPKVERICKIAAKSNFNSHASRILCAEAISKFVPEKDRADFKDIYDKSWLKAIEADKGYILQKKLDEM